MRWRSTCSATAQSSVSHTSRTAGHSHISYNADDAALFGAVSHWPAASHPPGAMREIYSWDLGIKLGEIPQPPKTYNVMGNANEQGLAIGETTHGGLSVLSNVGKTAANGTIMDYNNLISVTLQRASTAREAIKTMAWLANTYGYASDMEGFSIADSDEVWYMELIGKGSFEKGVVWVALRVPDGYVSAHANQARITTFLPCDDPSACMAAPDAASFAIKHGLWSGKPDDPAFSFSDVYDPLTFEGLRFCEARVWYIFSQIADPSHFDAQAFLPYARGANASARMPLFVKPKAKLSRHRIHELMSSHYEGSWFDPSKDVGAGAEHTPYRWNGLSWEYQNTTYVNERVVGTQYTSWHFVARVASKAVPSPMRAVLWWGADDHAYSPKIPIHGGATAIHRSYDDHNCTGRSLCRAAAGLPGTVTELSFDSAWWVNNLVSDVVYTRKDRAAPVVLAARASLDHELEQALAAAETAASKQFAAGDATAAVATLTAHAVAAGAAATSAWTKLWQSLMVAFIDGRVTKPDTSDHICGCTKEETQFGDAWKEKVIADTGAHYREPTTAPHAARMDAHGDVVVVEAADLRAPHFRGGPAPPRRSRSKLELARGKTRAGVGVVA